MLQEQLQKLGLAKNEITVYLALFDLGKIRAGKIIEHTGLHRNLVYTALDELVKNNLVSKVERGKVAVFEANNPKFLKDKIEKQIDIADEVIEELEKRQTIKPGDISISEGKEGIFLSRERAAREIKSEETYYVLGISEQNSDLESDRFFSKFNKKILKKGANMRVLFGNTSSGLAARRALSYGDNAKPLPFGAETPMWFSFYHDLLNISIADKDPVTFSIRSAPVVAGFKKYFDYFWNQDTYVLRGPEVIKDLWLGSIEAGELRHIGARGYFLDKYPKMWEEVKEKIIQTKNYRMRNIVDIGARGHTITQLPWAETKYLLSSAKNPNVVWLFGNKVAIANWTEDEPIVFISENKALVQSYNDYFDEMWNKN